MPHWSQALQGVNQCPNGVEIKKYICPVGVKPRGESIKCPNGVKIEKYICPVGVKPCRESIKNALLQ